MSYKHFQSFVMALIILPTLGTAFAVDDGINQNEETVRICMYGDQVHCEKIFGSIENSEWVLMWFYRVPDWYSTFSDYYENDLITEKEYIDVLEFGINHAFEYSQLRHIYHLNFFLELVVLIFSFW